MKRFRKNISKVFTIFLLLAFISSGVSLCDIVTSCKADTESCCCKTKDENPGVNLKKNCCCEIKENTVQISEVIIFKSETKPYNSFLSLNVFSGFDYSGNNFCSNNLVSFHSPPGSDICIINSILRI